MVSEDVFVRAVRTVLERHPYMLKERKEESEAFRNQPDLIWEMLLNNFATWGNAKGVALINTQALHDRVRYQTLLKLSCEQREKELRETFVAAHMRFADRKVSLMLDNFKWIEDKGGPDKVWEELEAQPTREAKVKYLDRFRGIGPKYARNMMMDICHPDFQNCIAIDSRIKQISEALGLKYGDQQYQEHEWFYVEMAKGGDWTGWELDRIMFTYSKELLAVIKENSTVASVTV